MLRTHRKQIELQLEDIRVTLEEIAQHEAAAASSAAEGGVRPCQSAPSGPEKPVLVYVYVNVN